MIDLPAFNLVSTCPKCGYIGGGPPRPPQVTHSPTGGSRLDIFPATDPFPVEYHEARVSCKCQVKDSTVEHLGRVCPCCGFRWAEACVPTTG